MFDNETVWEFNTAGRIKFGEGSSSELEDEIKSLNKKSALIFTDKGIENAGILDSVVREFEDVSIDVFSDVEPGPSLDIFESALDFAREVNPGVIIGLGGGSSIDVAKSTGVLYGKEGNILDYASPPLGKGKSIGELSLPVIAIPTSSGTGSETSPVSVISLPEDNSRTAISDKSQYPDLAIVDPLLTVSLPPEQTASTGIDALSHAIEAYVTRRYDCKERPDKPANRPDYGGRTTITDQFAKMGVDLIFSNLRRAFNNGKDVKARRKMSLGSLVAGIAFTNAGLGVAHALGLILGSEYHLSHGSAVASVLPEVMRYNAHASYSRYKDLASIMGLDVSRISSDEAAFKSADLVDELMSDLDMASVLSEIGVEKEDVPEIAKKSIRLQRLVEGNPRKVDKEDLEKILINSL